MHFIPLLTVASILILFIAFVSSSRHGVIYDPYIVCTGVAPNYDNGLPPTYSESAYSTPLTLCSAANGHYRNVGCLCPSSSSVLQCHEDIADSALFHARYIRNTRDPDRVTFPDVFPSNNLDTFSDFCDAACYCGTADEAATLREAERASSVSSIAKMTVATRMPRPTDGVQGATDVPYEPENPSPIAESATSASAASAGDGDWGQRTQNQCGRNCTTNPDCEGASGESCTCLAAQSTQYQPGSGRIAFIAACIVSLSAEQQSSRGEKRAEAWSCPCNRSYVSHECCRAVDGLVWEAEEFKLGELIP